MRLTCLFAVLSLMMTSLSWSAEELNFYTYHNKPPYYVGKDSTEDKNITGLYQTFVDLINHRQSDYAIKLVFVPRVRLEADLKMDKLNGAIMGVNQAWFKDKKMEKFLWSVPILEDKDVIVVNAKKSFQYQKPIDLVNKKLAIGRGLYYWGVTELIKEGKIKAYITNTDIQNLSMVKHSRADATIMSAPTVRYFFAHDFNAQEFNAQEFKILDVPHDQYERKILFPKNKRAQYQSLKDVISDERLSADWLKALKTWQ